MIFGFSHYTSGRWLRKVEEKRRRGPPAAKWIGLIRASALEDLKDQIGTIHPGEVHSMWSLKVDLNLMTSTVMKEGLKEGS